MKLKNWKITKYILAGILLILLITTPLMIKGYHKKREFDMALQRYSTSINQKAYSVAYSMADEEFKAATSYSKFTDIYQTLFEMYGEIKSTNQGRTIVEGKGNPTDWYAETDVNIQFEQGTINLRYWFHFVDGKWKLHGFENLN